MKSKKLIRSLLFSSVLSLLSVNSLGIFYTSNQSAQKRANKIKAASSQEIVLNVYNSEDYIAEEEKDDDGKVISKGVIHEFEDYRKEEKGVNIRVSYSCFDTMENMLSQLKMGSEYDLVCASDYIIEKRIKDDLVVPFETKEEFNADPYSSTLNYKNYASPFIRDKLSKIKREDKNGNPIDGNFNQYARDYRWGTLGILYNPEFKKLSQRDITPEERDKDRKDWASLWDKKYENRVSIKDSRRDTYAAGILYTYQDDFTLDGKEEEGFKTLLKKYNDGVYTAEEYNNKFSRLFNLCDDTTIESVEANLKTLRDNAYGFEVDSGKTDRAKGQYFAINLAWSGDAAWARSQADEFNEEHYKNYPNDKEFEPVTLKYTIPTLGGNIWCDCWARPKAVEKRGNKEYAQDFVDFLSDPEIAEENRDWIGYTPAIGSDTILDYIKENFGDVRYEENEDGEYEFHPEYLDDYTLVDPDKIDSLTDEEKENSIYKRDVSYFFKGTLETYSEEDCVIYLPASERNRTFDTSYPEESLLPSLSIRNDYGTQNDKITQRWRRVKNKFLPTWIYILVLVLILGGIGFWIYSIVYKRIRQKERHERKKQRQVLQKQRIKEVEKIKKEEKRLTKKRKPEEKKS